MQNIKKLQYVLLALLAPHFHLALSPIHGAEEAAATIIVGVAAYAGSKISPTPASSPQAPAKRQLIPTSDDNKHALVFVNPSSSDTSNTDSTFTFLPPVPSLRSHPCEGDNKEEKEEEAVEESELHSVAHLAVRSATTTVLQQTAISEESIPAAVRRLVEAMRAQLKKDLQGVQDKSQAAIKQNKAAMKQLKQELQEEKVARKQIEKTIKRLKQELQEAKAIAETTHATTKKREQELQDVKEAERQGEVTIERLEQELQAAKAAINQYDKKIEKTWQELQSMERKSQAATQQNQTRTRQLKKQIQTSKEAREQDEVKAKQLTQQNQATIKRLQQQLQKSEATRQKGQATIKQMKAATKGKKS